MLRTTIAAVGFLIVCWLSAFGLAEALELAGDRAGPYVCRGGAAFVAKPAADSFRPGSRKIWECQSADGSTTTCWRCFLVFTPALIGIIGCIAISWVGWARRRAALKAIDRLEVQRAMGFGTQSDYERQRRDLEQRVDDAE